MVKIQHWVSVILLIIGAVILSIAWYLISPGDAMGWAVLSTAVVWPAVVAVSSVFEILAHRTMRGVFVAVVLFTSLIVSFTVRFPGGALASGLIAMLITAGIHQLVISLRTRRQI